MDFRKLNAITKPDPFYMPTLDEVISEIGSCQVISRLDLTKGYYQIGLAEEDKAKTAFVCPYGKYEFSRMPIGLMNVPSVFQRLMEQVLLGCRDFCRAYLDDVVVYFASWKEHLKHVREVLQALQKAGLTAKPTKCAWGRRYLQYLGHIVGSGKLAVPEYRVTAMANFVRPTTKRSLRRFLGSVGYYRAFIEDFASHSAVLSPSTARASPDRLVWSEEMVRAFTYLHTALCCKVVLCVPNVNDYFVLCTDASSLGVGGVLYVLRDGVRRTVAFYSKQLAGAETRYSATELEALAVLRCIKHFAHWLWGRHFVVVTDHSPLQAWMSSRSLPRRLQGWALQLQDYSFEVVYRPGCENGEADALSCQNWSTEDPDEDRGEDDLRKGGCGSTPQPEP